MVQTIKISREEMGFINDLLNLPGDEIYQKYGYKRDETIIHTAKFYVYDGEWDFEFNGLKYIVFVETEK